MPILLGRGYDLYAYATAPLEKLAPLRFNFQHQRELMPIRT